MGKVIPSLTMVVAHRGSTYRKSGSTIDPENSEQAFNDAVADHVEMVEMDIRTSSDGVAFLLHDSTLMRMYYTSYPTSIDIATNVSTLPWDRIVSLAGHTICQGHGAAHYNSDCNPIASNGALTLSQFLFNEKNNIENVWGGIVLLDIRTRADAIAAYKQVRKLYDDSFILQHVIFKFPALATYNPDGTIATPAPFANRSDMYSAMAAANGEQDTTIAHQTVSTLAVYNGSMEGPSEYDQPIESWTTDWKLDPISHAHSQGIEIEMKELGGRLNNWHDNLFGQVQSDGGPYAGVFNPVAECNIGDQLSVPTDGEDSKGHSGDGAWKDNGAQGVACGSLAVPDPGGVDNRLWRSEFIYPNFNFLISDDYRASISELYNAKRRNTALIRP